MGAGLAPANRLGTSVCLLSGKSGTTGPFLTFGLREVDVGSQRHQAVNGETGVGALVAVQRGQRLKDAPLSGFGRAVSTAISAAPRRR